MIKPNLLHLSLIAYVASSGFANADSVEFLGFNDAGNTMFKVTDDNGTELQGGGIDFIFTDQDPYDAVFGNQVNRTNHSSNNGVETYIIEGLPGEVGDRVSLGGDWLQEDGVSVGPAQLVLADLSYTPPETGIANNTTAIEGNDGDIAANTTAISTNVSNISISNTAITSNTQSIEENTQGIASNTLIIGKNSQGIADSMAFGMVQQDVSYEGFQLSIGVASYNDYFGIAIVGGAKVTDKLFMNFGATGSGNYAASANFKF